MCKQWFKGMFQGAWRGLILHPSQYVWGLINIGLLLLFYICGIV